MAVFLARLFGKKAVFEKHSDPFSYRKGIIKNLFLSLYAAVENRVIKRADLIICTGTGLSQQVHTMGTGQPVHTIFDMPSSIREADPDKTARIGQRLRSNADEILVIYVGSFAVYQGVELMFAAMPGVLNGSDRVRFIIIGGSPDQIKTRREQLKEQGLDKRVTFVGVVPPDELPDYLAAADICLSPRHSGVNTPLKILDYYKAGRAIVATDIPANQIILNETTALFSRPDPDSFADQILALALDPDLRQLLGTNGRHLYEQKYSFAAFQKRLEHGYAVLDNP
jgi:glycosyltransferase involved in cell wall biosynthesis